MVAFYELVKDEEFSGATVFVGGETFTVASDNPNWLAIRAHLLDDVDDDEKLKSLIAPAKSASDALLRVTERVTFKAGALFFDGDPLENALADHIVRIIESGADQKDYTSFGLFLEKLSQNPSKKSRKHLYSFIETHGMTVADDGDLIAYKGVRSDGMSINSGYGIVDGVEYGAHSGHMITTSAALPNHIGAVVEIPRSMVDDNRDRACSSGLHAGTYQYASNFSQGLLLTVKVNPRDVVSVPHDAANAKIRTCRYVVLEENKGNITTPTYFRSEPVVPYEEEDDDFAPSTYEEAQAEDEGLEGAEEESGEAVAGPDGETDETVSDDALADALEAALDKADADGGTVSVTVVYSNGRDAKGHFVKGDDNPGKKVKRGKNGKFKKSH